MQRLRRFLSSSRASRGLVGALALMTIWNLGCVGFQPLLASDVGSAADRGMTSEAEGMLVVPAHVSPTPGNRSDASMTTVGPERGVASISAPGANAGGSRHAAVCGCQSCHAPPSSLQSVDAPASLLPLAPALAIVVPPSTVRTPLDPPPQLAL